MPRRVALYHRVSTLDQDVTLARAELRQAAIARGYVIAMEVEEVGSGTRADRPGLVKVVAAAQARKVDVVMVHRLDRLGRSVIDVLATIKTLQQASCAFVAITQGLEIQPEGDGVSALILGVLASVAAFEVDLIRSRTKLGLAKARAAGKHIGRPRKGAKPDSQVVAALRAAGTTWAAIAAQLGCTVASARRACQTGCSEAEVQLLETVCAA